MSFYYCCLQKVTYRAVSFQANCWPFLVPGQMQSVDSSLKMVTSSRESLPVWWWAGRALVGPWWLSVERETSDEWPKWLEVEEEFDAVDRWPDSGVFIVIGWSCPFSSNIPTFWRSLVVVVLVFGVSWFCCCSSVFVSSASAGSGTRWKRFSPIGVMMIDCGLLEDWLGSVDAMASCNSLTESEVLLVVVDALELVVVSRPLVASDGSSETKAFVKLDKLKRRGTLISGQ